MRTVDVHDAQTHSSRLVADAAAGDEIVIANAGKPLAKLVPFSSPARPRKLGSLKGKLRAHADFDRPLSEHALREFED